MRKVTGATSLDQPDLRAVVQDGKITSIYDSEAPPGSMRDRLRSAVQDRRSSSSLSVVPSDADGHHDHHDPLPIFLNDQDEERDEIQGEDDEAANAPPPPPRRRPRMPEPEFIDPPEPPRRSRGPAMLRRAAVLAVVVAGMGGLFLAGQALSHLFAGPEKATAAAGPAATMGAETTTPSFGNRFDAVPQKRIEAQRVQVARLGLAPTVPHAAGEASALGIAISGAAPDATVTVGGLAAGTSLNRGRAEGANQWRLAAADAGNATLQPPTDFTGAMDLAIELRSASDAVLDRKTVRLEWTAPPATAAHETIHPLPPAEIAALLKRGDELIASGDVAAARLVLRKAAQAGDARAATKLAGTYDPAVLAKLGTHGVVPDIDAARRWYEKAQKYGATDARQRLEALASKRQ